MRRIYFALTFSQEEEASLLQYRSQLIECASSLKPIPENSLHMTLAFIGESDEDTVTAMRSILSEITFKPFTFTVSGLDYVPERQGKRLYYLTTSHDEGLYALQKQLTDRLKAHKQPFHDKAFLPHMTLARKTVLHKEPKFPIDCTLHVSSIHLLESIPYENTRIGIIIDNEKRA